MCVRVCVCSCVCVQKLVEVLGLGLITCGEGEDGNSVHTLLRGVVQVFHELLVDEEEEEEEEQGRRSKRREHTHVWMTMWMV